MSININDKEFKIIKELGKGGFGRVIHVLSESDNKHYALKEIPIKGETKEKIESFQNEATILSKFDCENIVKYYDSSKDANNIYILMELCDGKNLRNFIDENINDSTLIEEKIIYNIISQICTGIKEIHDKKIIHRDLKPENIFMNENMTIKLGDFGISKQFDSYKTHTLTINKTGTEFYAAPEIIDDGIYNEKSDIWSLGCIIYELFHFRIYYKDAIRRKIKNIDSEFYNNKWQKLIDSLLESDYKKRFNIYQVIKYLEEELNIKEKDSIKKNENEKNITNINNKVNIIIGEIYIKEEDLNKDIRIINSYENVKRENYWRDKKNDLNYENEKEIKENIEIKIDGKIIEFTYYYKFNKVGKHKIEYSFKNNISKTCFMFWWCDKIINLNLSNFNTQNVTNMSYMFYYCKSLTNLNLSNFNTKNVTDMSHMFSNCDSLKDLNLSNFNTQNVTNMSDMFYNCHQLPNLNLLNFNTQKVTDMSYMFWCCNSLKDLDLSNFNTQNVISMNDMFYYCFSLTNLNLSNFNTQNVTNMSSMLSCCKSLNKSNIITKDVKILNEF